MRVVVLGVFYSLWKKLLISHGFPTLSAAVGHFNFSFDKSVPNKNVFLMVEM